jgi:hypothetical protein
LNITAFSTCTLDAKTFLLVANFNRARARVRTLYKFLSEIFSRLAYSEQVSTEAVQRAICYATLTALFDSTLRIPIFVKSGSRNQLFEVR